MMNVVNSQQNMVNIMNIVDDVMKMNQMLKMDDMMN